ncbi:MAG: alkaline phosphatase family protein [Deltaproteobacteria bacterium]|nr:alkaline phosphatase family protein [Deltaproteobacteria bacterium]
MTKKTPILMIGLDAAEVTLIDRYCAAGMLPALQSLKEKGCFGLLRSNATIFAGGVWPSFYTSKDVPWHGVYHNKLWRHEKMRCEVVNGSWLYPKPFWEYLDAKKYRIVLFDVPTTLGIPNQINGIFLAGWGSHDISFKASWPPNLWKQIEKKFGYPVMRQELIGPQNKNTLLKLKENMLKETKQKLLISEFLLTQERCDLFFVVFGATHRGAHYLWNLSQIDAAKLTPEIRGELERGLIDLYRACDFAIARLIEKAPQNAYLLVFALHGMGENLGWSDRCSDILFKIQQINNNSPVKHGLIYKIKQAMPSQLTRQIVTSFPQGIQNRLVTLWSANMFDWSKTKYFPLPMDHAGYIRINLKGREPQGIVEPGNEYNAICNELEEAFLSFRDIKTNKPIVDKVYHLDDRAPLDAPHRDVLPDLVVKWGNISANESSGIRSDKYGEINWNNVGKLPSGRSGNHLDIGWFVAVGDGIPRATRIDDYPILDLVPTVFKWLGAEPREDFQGKPIPALYLK